MIRETVLVLGNGITIYCKKRQEIGVFVKSSSWLLVFN